jgi:hypothetical protein
MIVIPLPESRLLLLSCCASGLLGNVQDVMFPNTRQHVTHSWVQQFYECPYIITDMETPNTALETRIQFTFDHSVKNREVKNREVKNREVRNREVRNREALR